MAYRLCEGEGEGGWTQGFGVVALSFSQGCS